MDTRWIPREHNTGDVLSPDRQRKLTQRSSTAPIVGGHPIASWLLGTPSSGGSQYNAFPINMYKYFAPWIQDDWRVTRKLSVNLGFRWDLNVPANERFNRLNRSFDRTVTNPADSLVTEFPAARCGAACCSQA